MLNNFRMLKIYKPDLDDLWFREKILNDKETMSYNNRWGGTIPFPKEKWEGWFDYWIANPDNKRFYGYLVNENNEFVGETAYHFDGEHYLANIIVFATFRRKGYGSEGLKILCDKAKENGIKEIYDDIAIDNPAVKMFLSQGFAEIYRTNEIIILKKDLC